MIVEYAWHESLTLPTNSSLCSFPFDLVCVRLTINNIIKMSKYLVLLFLILA